MYSLRLYMSLVFEGKPDLPQISMLTCRTVVLTTPPWVSSIVRRF